MSLLSPFSKKKTTERLELEIVLAKLKFLASALEDNTDKETDDQFWQEELLKLNEFETLEGTVKDSLIDAYYVLYHIFRKRHFEE